MFLLILSNISPSEVYLVGLKTRTNLKLSFSWNIWSFKFNIIDMVFFKTILSSILGYHCPLSFFSFLPSCRLTFEFHLIFPFGLLSILVLSSLFARGL